MNLVEVPIERNKRISEKPRKHCTTCNREVYQTVHKSVNYRVDWYTEELKVICIDCYSLEK